MIVKVQLSQHSSVGSRVLIYDKRRTVQYEGPATPDVVELMDGAPKKFFHAELKDGLVHLDAEATWQNW